MAEPHGTTRARDAPHRSGTAAALGNCGRTGDDGPVPSTRPEQGARPTDRPPGAPGQGSLAVLWRQLVAFTGIGIVLTVAYLGLYAVLREVMGA